MMTDRYPRSQQRSWFVPTLVVVGIAGFFLWESGWRPFEVLDVPTGTVDQNGQAEQKTAATDSSETDYSLPDITPQQFEPDVDDLSPDDLNVDFNAHEAIKSTMVPNTGVTQTGYTTPDPGDTTGFTESDFADPPPPADVPEATPPVALTPTPTPKPKPTPRPSAELMAKLNKIDFLLEENDYLTAHRDLSTLYWYEPENRAIFLKRLQQTAHSIYAAQQPHYMKPYVVQPGDTLGKIAEKYNVPWTYLARLNSVAPNRVREGAKLKVVRGPFGAVVDLSDFELTIHAHGYYVRSYKIGIGAGSSTPIGEFKIKDKLENPQYYAPEGGIIAADDPANPLGEYWMGIGDGYGIHGTIDPSSIGKAESRGCIRLGDGDIQEVFDLLTTGSPVMIRR